MSEKNPSDRSPLGLAKSLIGIATDSFSGLNAALEFLGGIKDLIKDDKAGSNRQVCEQLINLTDQLLTVKEHNAALRQALLDMEELLDQREQFEAEAGNYVLEETAPNAFAYVAKAAGGGQTPIVRLCTHCFGKKQKSILQFSRADDRSDILSCPNCGLDTHVAVDRGPAVMIAYRDDPGLW